MPELLPIPKSKRFKDLTGTKHGRLTVLGYLGRPGHVSRWLCKCDCGTEIETSGPTLGKTTFSCGCFRADRMSRLTYKHGGRCRDGSQAPEWKVWEGFRSRCSDPDNPSYEWYGGRGIRVCAEWQSDYAAFFAHVGPRPSKKHSLDRIDRDGHYEPGNVRWATWTEQARNRRNNRIVEFDGRSMPLIEAAEAAGIPYKSVKSRLLHGWTVEEALTTPLNMNKVNAVRRNSRKT